MELNFSKKGTVLIVEITGDIDHHTCHMLRQETDRHLEEMRGRHILFCFREVAFMDSSGIGVLIGRYKKIKGLGGKVAVACAGDKIQEIFHISALDRLIPAFCTMADAVQYLEGGDRA